MDAWSWWLGGRVHEAREPVAAGGSNEALLEAAAGRLSRSPRSAGVEPACDRPLAVRRRSRRSRFQLDRPQEGELICGPLVATGRLPRFGPCRLPLLGGRFRPRLLIDRRPAADLAWAFLDGDRFALVVAVGDLAEGAHALSLGRNGAAPPAESRRTVHFRRPPAGADLAAGDRGTVVVRKLARRLDAARVELRIDGRPWPLSDWLCGRNRDGRVGVAGLDLRGLAPGLHRLELRPLGHPVTRLRLLRLAG